MRNKSLTVAAALALWGGFTLANQSEAQAKRGTASASQTSKVVNVPRLVGQLGDPNILVARSAKSQLIQAGTQVVPAVIPVLTDIDPQARMLAAEVLSGLGASAGDAGARVAAALPSEKEAEVKAAMIAAVGKIGAPARAAIPHLADLLSSEDWTLRLAAARALGDLGSMAAAAEPQLAVALLDAAGWAMIGGDATRSLVFLDAIKKVSNPPTSPAVIPAVFCATNSNLGTAFERGRQRSIQNEAGDVLIKFSERSLPLMVSTIRDPGPITKFCLRAKRDVEGSLELRQNAVVTLGYLGAPAVTPLIQLLQDPREDERDGYGINFRAQAAKALGNIGPSASAALPVLAQVLQLDGDDAKIRELKQEARTAVAKIRKQP